MPHTLKSPPAGLRQLTVPLLPGVSVHSQSELSIAAPSRHAFQSPDGRLGHMSTTPPVTPVEPELPLDDPELVSPPVEPVPVEPVPVDPPPPVVQARASPPARSHARRIMPHPN